ncbi:MAG: MoaD/ThiS family protein [Actinobacteria bacterium]|nr:MoaD/ThiS family protein [Actinomycetota bacterium]MBV8957678.1 MoaD/ThiS family protein [Actinomycetota bacterium]MBV9666226.1 MoaD/ThiS family protein [Actinomycetota bacterium]MBV9933921.1 MoaD/ThiS family protein [Actinomycetota bacterium]
MSTRRTATATWSSPTAGPRSRPDLARLRLFAAAREAAGVGAADVEGGTVEEVLRAATARFGTGFGDVLATSRVWVNGEPAVDATLVAETDEVAVLPPVSGG